MTDKLPTVLQCSARELRCPTCKRILRRINMMSGETMFALLTVCDRSVCRQHLLALRDGPAAYTLALDRHRYTRLLMLESTNCILSAIGMRTDHAVNGNDDDNDREDAA